jgi:hypothetical protein
MQKRLRKRPTDVNLLAHMLGKQSTEEPKANGTPTKAEISRIMAAMGRKGGKKGGKARAARMLGGRDAGVATQFIYDLRQRLANRVQLTSDGYKPYLQAVDYAFGGMNIDYAMLIKIYGETSESQKRYSPAECIGCERKEIVGRPDPKHISTSFAERQNLSVRMGLRRYTRLTNAFSRKIENHSAAVALYYFAYNFIKIHGTLRCTPAMAAGVTDRLWEVSDLVALLEADERGLERAA